MIAPIVTFFLVSCGPDETVSGYADPSVTYVLTEHDTERVSYRATIRFPEEGNVTGAGPCNRFNAAQTAPYPWIDLGPIASTRRACPDLAEESAYFAALREMEFAEVTGKVLILSNSNAGELVFQAE